MISAGRRPPANSVRAAARRVNGSATEDIEG
jgi:hypothetical protein